MDRRVPASARTKQEARASKLIGATKLTFVAAAIALFSYSSTAHASRISWMKYGRLLAKRRQ